MPLERLYRSLSSLDVKPLVADQSPQPRFTCCGRKFKYANLLTYHKRWECGRIFKCQFCNRQFSGKRTFVQHSPMRCRTLVAPPPDVLQDTSAASEVAHSVRFETTDVGTSFDSGDFMPTPISLRPRPRRGKNFADQLKARPN